MGPMPKDFSECVILGEHVDNESHAMDECLVAPSLPDGSTDWPTFAGRLLKAMNAEGCDHIEGRG